MTLCNCFYNTTCQPEPIPVQQTVNEITTEAGFLAPVLTYAADTTSSGRLKVQAEIDGAPVERRCKIVVWFEDTATFTGLVTMDPPTTPGAGMVEYITNADGKIIDGDTFEGVLVQDNASPAKTWFAYARIGGNVCAAPVPVSLGS